MSRFKTGFEKAGGLLPHKGLMAAGAGAAAFMKGKKIKRMRKMGAKDLMMGGAGAYAWNNRKKKPKLNGLEKEAIWRTADKVMKIAYKGFNKIKKFLGGKVKPKPFHGLKGNKPYDLF